MKTAIFNKDKQILGFLEHSRTPWLPNCFYMCPRPKLPLQPAADDGLAGDVTITNFRFVWNAIIAYRENGAGHRCDVLIVEPAEKIDSLDGFTWFSEEFGEPLPRLNAVYLKDRIYDPEYRDIV